MLKFLKSHFPTFFTFRDKLILTFIGIYKYYKSIINEHFSEDNDLESIPMKSASITPTSQGSSKWGNIQVIFSDQRLWVRVKKSLVLKQ